MNLDTCYDCGRGKETKVVRIPGPVGYYKKIYCAAKKGYVRPMEVGPETPCVDFRKKAGE